MEEDGEEGTSISVLMSSSHFSSQRHRVFPLVSGWVALPLVLKDSPSAGVLPIVQRSESFLSPLMSLSCHTGLAYLAILYFKIEIEFHVAKMINWPSTTSTQN